MAIFSNQKNFPTKNYRLGKPKYLRIFIFILKCLDFLGNKTIL
jgi:hypothetical protein